MTHTEPNTRSKAIDRRTFIDRSTAGAIALTLTPTALLSCDSKLPSAQIALQLYTLRREIEIDLMGTLKKVANIGYTAVETAFWPDHISLAQAAKALRDSHLKVCSVHCELPLGTDRSEMLKLADAYNCTKMIWHGWPEDHRYQSVDGIRELAEVYNECNQFAQTNGLEFGLHNHWWEFRNNVSGKYPYQILIDHLDSDVFFEIDTYWVKVAGYDPAVVVAGLGNRAPLLHIKDGPARYTESLGKDEPEPMVAVGQGVQDFPAIVKAANGHTRWMIVEMDVTASDVFKAIEQSFNYLISNRLAYS